MAGSLSSFTSHHLHRKDSLMSLPKRAPVLKLLIIPLPTLLSLTLGIISVIFVLKHIYTQNFFFIFGILK